jgi:hypothetical protein
MMKTALSILLIVLTLSVQAQKTFETTGLKISIGQHGEIVSLYGNQEYIPIDAESFLIRIKTDGKELLPEKVSWRDVIAELTFANGVVVSIEGSEKDDYITFEVVDVQNVDRIDVLLWGPFATTINETIGEYVGVVRNSEYAIGYQSLNVKTTGGKILNTDGSDEARGTAATKENYGSSLQGYCVNRDKDRIYNIWNDRIPNAFIPANPEGKIEGSAIALFGTEVSGVLDILEKIEIQEGLPHVTINGEWVKRSREANKPYLITTFTEENIDACLDYCEKLGYNSLYHEHPFKNWGHFDLIEAQFPNGWEGMKKCVEKASERGIRLGVHTLTNFITTNDPYVSPVPHEDLMVFCKTKITKDLSIDAQELYIEDPSGYEVRNTCQAIRIGNEIIQFGQVTEEPPYKLLKCKRGAYGTEATEHSKGESIARLADHGYKTLFPNFELQKEMIDRLADFFNYTGIAQMDFDGHEGGWGTGEGDFGMDYFSDRLVKEVNHEMRNGSSRSNHYYWHVNSYLNWGEPWYGGFTKSQGHYRYQNQALLKRNYTPNMLGWFLLNSTTTVQEFEYMLARSAGYDAGYALYTKLISLAQNKEFPQISDAINIWEEARLKRIFNNKQMEDLKNVNNDFSLNKSNVSTFELQYYTKEKFELLNEMVQPGQPNDVTVEFEIDAPQNLYFVIGAVGEKGSINQVTIIYNGVETISLDLELKPNYSFTYRGDNKILVYDEKGRMRRIIDLDIEDIEMGKGTNNLRISAEFSDNADMKLEGYVRLKDKVDTIPVN